MLKSAAVNLVFMPAADEMYPRGFTTLVRVSGLTEGLCGAHRAGHFDGVTTVVTKLLIQALPDIAYFGEKDYQQLMVVRRLARDLDIPVQIAGRADSPRAERARAVVAQYLFVGAGAPHRPQSRPGVALGCCQSLKIRAGLVARELARGVGELREAGFEVEYLEIREEDSLTPVTNSVAARSRVFAAVRLGKTRLIDNMPIGQPGSWGRYNRRRSGS